MPRISSIQPISKNHFDRHLSAHSLRRSMSLLTSDMVVEAPTFGPGAKSDVEPTSPVSPLWQTAIRKYYTELEKGGIKSSLIDKDLWKIQSPDELIAHIEAVGKERAFQSATWTQSLARLKPVLLGLNDFAVLTSWLMGMNGKVAAVLWGSIRLIIKFAQPVLPDIIEMLETLEHALPRMQQYEQELPMTDTLEKALSDMYGEIIVFCAHAIAFFRNNPEVSRNRTIWSQFSNDFSEVIGNVRKCSRRVDEAADMIRLSREVRNSGTLAALQEMQGLRISDDVKLPCFMIPYGLNLRFFGRVNELNALREFLDPKPERKSLCAAGVYGLGGVGKSQLALHYANTSMEIYDVVAWIPSETQIKLVQALSTFANKLGLTAGGSEDEYQGIQKVRDWLNTSKKTFLLIFDNVEDINILDQVWPASDNGSIIITTRSPSQASKRASKTLALQSFSLETGKSVLESLTCLKPADQDDEAAAQEICQLLGGLPLAMVQISDFIRDRGYSYTEFLRIYKKSAEKIFAKSENPVEYDYTVFTTWNISLQKLSEKAIKLQNLLVFFDPDLIPERLITNTKAEIDDPSVDFLFDEFDFGEAVMELTRTSMISRLSSSKGLSMHRLVQLAVFSRLSKVERVELFDLTVQILYFDFPDTWQNRGARQGHGWQSWETCSAILSHVSWLMQLSSRHIIKSKAPDRWAELIFRAGTYLWEKDQPAVAKSFFEFGLSIDENVSGPVAAQAHRLLGHVFLDLARPHAALAAYKTTLALRQKLDGVHSPFVADVCDSVACSYTEAGDVEHAFEYLEKATAIHNAHDPSKMTRTLAIRAMTCLRAGQPEDALASIRECWRLQGMTQKRIETSSYPKHSGDVMLLARIFWLQGNKAEAQELVSRTITMRRGTFGENGGPRVADSVFTLARLLEDAGELVLAAKLLRQVIEMSGDAPGMKPHKARAFWFSANIEAKIGGEEAQVAELRENARAVRQTIEDRVRPDDETDAAFMKLVSWMLW